MNALVPVQTTMEVAPARQPTVAEMLSVAVQREVTPETAAVVEKLAALMERQEDRSAEREFATAFCAMQSEMPEVVACKVIPKGAGVKYAPTEDIMRTAKPFLTRHGFSVTLTTENPTPDRVTGVAKLMHRGGHSITARIVGRLGAKSDDPMTGDSGTATRMQREALCDVLGIMRRTGNAEDAAIIGNGQTITPEQSMELEQRAKDCGANIPALLQFAGATSFDAIPAAKLDTLDAMLKRKEAVHK